MNPERHPDYHKLLKVLESCEKRLPPAFRGPWPKPNVKRIMWGMALPIDIEFNRQQVSMQFSGMTMKYSMDLHSPADIADVCWRPLSPPFPELRRMIELDQDGDLVATYIAMIRHPAGNLCEPPFENLERIARYYPGDRA